MSIIKNEDLKRMKKFPRRKQVRFLLWGIKDKERTPLSIRRKLVENEPFQRIQAEAPAPYCPAVRLLTDSPMKEAHGMDIKELNLQPRVPFSVTILFKTEGRVWM